VASDAPSIASTALLALCDRIESTKRKMLDAKEQMALAELLTQLSKAELAVKRLEKMAGDV